ncbi:MAG: helix-turn-helix domain-containing protein [Oscillospiraceae bacterium]|nr:helix-turn-helix domain-containing protein [Oscillospiraceae bacterium]
MTTNSKQELISKIVTLLNELIDVEEKTSMKIPQADKKVEMLTIKECTELVKGLSEHTVRQLVIQDKIPYVRAGQGKRGKILISKADLLSYLNMSA